MWMAYALNLNNYQLSRLTLKEFVNLWQGYIWRKQQQENTIAGLVTVWIANTAGKSLKKNISIEQVFKDGRFKKALTDDDKAMIAELYGEEVK
jgi:hypothetical protein